LVGKFLLFSSFPPEGQLALARDHFAMFLVPATHVASVNADGERTIRRQQLVPIPLAAFDERPWLLANSFSIRSATVTFPISVDFASRPRDFSYIGRKSGPRLVE
jgi:hypothetical protein